MLRTGDDFHDTQACATPISVPTTNIPVQWQGPSVDLDWLRFTPTAGNIYWTHCGSDDPICFMRVKVADGGTIANSQTWPSINDLAWGHVDFIAPAAAATLWLEVTPEMGHSSPIPFSLDSVGPDDHTTTTITAGTSTRTAWLQTRTDEDVFEAALPPGMHTLTIMQRPRYSGFALNDTAPPGMGIAQGRPTTGTGASSHNFTLFTATTVRLRFFVIAASDMAGQGRVDFTLQ